MKAVTLVKQTEAKNAFEIREIDTPKLVEGGVLIKVSCFGLNFADVMARQGLYKAAPPMPSVLGYDVVGVVEQLGEGVDQNWMGKRVVAMTRFGGYAEYALTVVDAMVELPESIPDGEAVSLATQYSTAYFMAEEMCNFYPGDKVLVHAAAGGVGTALVQLLKLKGCEVFGNAGSEEKLNYLRTIGVDHPINYREKDFEEEIRAIIGEDGQLDATFNAVGGKTFKKDLKLLGPGGRAVAFGAADRSGRKGGFFANLKLLFSMGFHHPLFLMMGSKSIIGVNMLAIADHKPAHIKRALNRCVELVKEGKLKPTVGGEFHVDEIAKAHELLEKRSSIGKISVYWKKD